MHNMPDGMAYPFTSKNYSAAAAGKGIIHDKRVYPKDFTIKI